MNFHQIETYLLCPLKAQLEKASADKPKPTLDEAVEYAMANSSLTPPDMIGQVTPIVELLNTVSKKSPYFIHVTKRKPDFEKVSPIFRLKLEWLSLTLIGKQCYYCYYAVMTKTPTVIEHQFRLPTSKLRLPKIISLMENGANDPIPTGLSNPYACSICQFAEVCEYSV